MGSPRSLVLEAQENRDADEKVEKTPLNVQRHLNLSLQNPYRFHVAVPVRSGAPDVIVWLNLYRALAGAISPPWPLAVRVGIRLRSPAAKHALSLVGEARPSGRGPLPDRATERSAAYRAGNSGVVSPPDPGSPNGIGLPRLPRI